MSKAESSWVPELITLIKQSLADYSNGSSCHTIYVNISTVQLSPGELFHQRQGWLVVPSTNQTREAPMDTGAPVRLGGFWLGKRQDGKRRQEKQKIASTLVAITKCLFGFVIKGRSKGQLKHYFCRCSNLVSSLEPSLWPCLGLAANEQEGQGATALSLMIL